MAVFLVFRAMLAWLIIFGLISSPISGVPNESSGTLDRVAKAVVGKKLKYSGRTISTCQDRTRVFVAGSITYPDNTVHSVVLAFDPYLHLLWMKEWPEDGPAGVHAPSAIVASPDCSQVYVTGQTMAVGGSENYETRAYDASDGTLLWQQTYDNGGSDVAFAIDVTPDGGVVIVTGSSTGAGLSSGGVDPNQDFATIAYDAHTGAQLWVSRHGRVEDFDKATVLEISPDGTRVYVAGYSVAPDRTRTYSVVSYDTWTGGQLWESAGPWWISIAVVEAITISADGTKIVVAGEAESGIALVIYYSQTGAQYALEPMCPGTYCRATDAQMGADGNTVFITGYAYESTTSYDMFTAAIDISDPNHPATIWEQRYDAAGKNDFARDLEMSEDGSLVFVAGTSIGDGENHDGILLAYDSETGEEFAQSDRWDFTGRTDDFLQMAPGANGSDVCVTGFSERGEKKVVITVLCYAAQRD